jgi:hypothetical protein
MGDQGRTVKQNYEPPSGKAVHSPGSKSVKVAKFGKFARYHPCLRVRIAMRSQGYAHFDPGRGSKVTFLWPSSCKQETRHLLEAKPGLKRGSELELEYLSIFRLQKLFK